MRQQHCLYSRFTNKLVDVTGTKIVFQYRSIKDALAFLIDHYDDALFGSMQEKHTMPSGAHNLNRENLRDYVIDIELPWYRKFLSGWMTSDLAITDTFYTKNYDDLKASPSNTVFNLSKALDLGFSEKDVATAVDTSSSGFTRLNKGLSGRGLDQFTSEQKEKMVRCMHYFKLGAEVSNLI